MIPEVMTNSPKKDRPAKEVKPVAKDKPIKEERPKRTRIKLKTADSSGEENNQEQDEPASGNSTENFTDVDESLTQIGANLLSMLGDDEPIVYPDEVDEPVALRGVEQLRPPCLDPGGDVEGHRTAAPPARNR